MNKATLGLLLIPLALGANAEVFTVDTDHAVIGFSVKHLMVSNTKGTFNTFEGTIDYDLATKSLVSAQGSIAAASIDTNNEKRDAHLKNDDFFNVVKHPRMEFKSTSVKKTGDNTFEVSGTLTVLGIERKVVLPATVTGPVDDPWGNIRIGIECRTVLNRRDLGIVHSPSAVIGDEVAIHIDAEAILKKEP